MKPTVVTRAEPPRAKTVKSGCIAPLILRRIPRLSFLLGGFPAGGAFVSLTVLCTLYSRSFETGFLLLKPAAPIICSFAAAFDALTAMFGSYIVAVKTKCIEHHGIKHFI